MLLRPLSPTRQSRIVVPLASETTGVSGLAERYAAALFDLADEAAMLDAVAGDLRQLRAMLRRAATCRGCCAARSCRARSRARRSPALASAAGLSPLVRDFLAVVAQQPAAVRGPGDDRGLSAKLAERRGEVTAEVTAAQPLSEDPARGADRATAPQRRHARFGRCPGRSGPDRRDDRQGRLAHGRRLVEQQAAAAAAGDEGVTG